MSKYIENRIKKIKELSDTLKSHNSYINNAINLIQPLCNNDINISIFTNSIKNNNSIYYNIFSLRFFIDNQIFSYYSFGNEFSFSQEDIPFKYISIINNFLNKLNNSIDLEETFLHTQETIKIFKEIEKLHKEIDLKSSGFKEKYSLLIHSIKENFPISNFNINDGLYFNLKNNNSIKSISFHNVTTIRDIKDGIHLKLPDLKVYDIKGKDDSFKNFNDYTKYLTNKSSIIKQDFFDLNSDFFNYIQLPIESIFLELSILDQTIEILRISDLNEEQLSIAVEKINLEKMMSNF